jgi:anti-sigma regulatory factor (Ser/Thr protein kinase)
MAEELHITNEINQLDHLNEFLRQTTGGFDLRPDVRMNLRLAIEEAVANVILYAYPGETNQDICIRVEHSDTEISIVVTDSGLAFDPTAEKEPDVSLPCERRPVGGLGIVLMKQLMTKVSYSRTGNKNVLTMIKKYSE